MQRSDTGPLAPRFAVLGGSVGRGIATAVEALKGPLMAAIGALSAQPLAAALASALVGPHQLAAGQGLLALYAPLSEKELEKESARRQKASFGETLTRLGVCVPYVKSTEMGYRDPSMGLTELHSAARRLSAFATATSGAHPHHPRGGGSTYAALAHNGLAKKEREALDEELRCLDIGNDECDFGYGLEVGANLLYACGGCACGPCVAALSSPSQQSALTPQRRAALERAVVGEGLWHAVRVLDTAYSLLNRPFGRLALRAYVRLVVRGMGAFEVAIAE